MGGIVVSFDADAYTADAIQRAAYRFCDRLSIELTRAENVFSCTVFAASGDDVLDATVADFRIEVLDQVLRDRIRSETEASRNLILALAFSKTDLVAE